MPWLSLPAGWIPDAPDKRDFRPADERLKKANAVVETAKTAIPRLFREIHVDRRPRRPLMTKRLFDGVALAEDPGNGDSFGLALAKPYLRSACADVCEIPMEIAA